MIILQTILVLLVRSLGRVFNMAFGWATIMLFGRIPQERQIFLSVVALGSIVWLTAAVGVAFPAVAAFLLAFVSLPQWVHHDWIRIAMLTAVLIVPPLVGEAAIRAVRPGRRPMGWYRAREALVSGYRFTSGIAVALVALMLVAPFLGMRNLVRRWRTRHIPIVVHREDYPTVLDDVQRALVGAGIPVERDPGGGLLRLSTVILAFASGGSVQGLGAGTARLTSRWVEILLYPFDLVISGDAAHVSRAQSIVAERLPHTRAYMTWSEQGNSLEDRLKGIWRRVETDAREALRAAEALAEIERTSRDIGSACLAYEEWEVIFRQLLMVEREVLRREQASDRALRGPGIARALI